MKFHVTIQNFVSGSSMTNCVITWDNEIEDHGPKEIKTNRDRIVGEQREDLKFMIAANSSSTVRNQMIITANDVKKVPNIEVFHQIKNEHNNINNIDKDIHSNIVKCVDFFKIVTTSLKKLYVGYSETASCSELNGFVQEYNFKPFGVTLLSEIQIHFWKEIQKIMPIWYFDATGSCHKRIDGSAVNLYSFVCHDYINKINVPIALFLSSSHTTASISKFLLCIKQHFVINSDKSDSFKFSPIMVTDESWAIINSLCETFNGQSIKSYVKWTYEVLLEYPDNRYIRTIMKTKLFLCHVHFLYNATKKIKTLNLCKEKQDIFIYGFIGLQNCKNIQEFKSIFKSLFLLFSTKSCQLQIIQDAKELIYSLRIDQVNLNSDKIQEEKLNLCYQFDDLYINDNFHGK